VAGEERVVRADRPTTAQRRLVQVNGRDRIHEEEGIAVGQDSLNLGAAEADGARLLAGLPEQPLPRPPDHRRQRFRLHG
jgi:hypothetical protein